jgi:UDP-2,3-diacylglucosamine pyrophosphatase LpxH
MKDRILRAACLPLLVLLGLLTASTIALAQLPAVEAATVADVPYRPPPGGARYLAFISDLHFGVGRKSDRSWHPTEDFRWPKALEGFLNEISRLGRDRVDLIIVGDFLELWQPPTTILCKGISADLGCTLDEMEALAELVASAHSDGLTLLRAFAERGENRLHVIPGNHDAALRYQRVWRPVGAALADASGRINLVVSGVWSSADGRVVAEHGHQIGLDVNRYETWPRIIRRVDDIIYVIRPWGELFVQKLFNQQEEQYPIIDNLSPETAGARYRSADRGVWGSTADVARLLFFNLWETSPSQRAIMLGEDSTGKRDWNLQVARKMGAGLFLNALPVEDPLRKQIEAGGAEAGAVKAELAAMAGDPARVPDEVILHLCDLIADRGEKSLCLEPQLGSLVQYSLIAKDKVLARHLRARQSQFKSVTVFIYGHTHQYEVARELSLNDLVKVTVVNTGAFQRLIDESGFLRRLNGVPPQEGLRTLGLDQLPPCYSAVLIPTSEAKPELHLWHMTEDAAGVFVPPGDPRCK